MMKGSHELLFNRAPEKMGDDELEKHIEELRGTVLGARGIVPSAQAVFDNLAYCIQIKTAREADKQNNFATKLACVALIVSIINAIAAIAVFFTDKAG